MSAAPSADLAVFGGSGFYAFLDDVTEVVVDTPYGAPAAPLSVGTIGDRRVAFLPRHGRDHELPAHVINYRANLWAMRATGARRIFAPCASGSLQPHVEPGHFVVCDQLVDRTHGRGGTFFDGPTANHISFADPYCAELSRVSAEAARTNDIAVHDRGTIVVVQGPRFSTRAESRWYRAQGWEVINMTQAPEAALARELGMCYAAIALITDYDTGVEGEAEAKPVTQEEVFAFFKANVARVRDVLFTALAEVSLEPSCECADAPGGIDVEPPTS